MGVTSDGFSLSATTWTAKEPSVTGVTLATVSIPFEHQQAAKPQRDNIVRQLSKLGGTAYECSGVDMATDFDYFIPSSMLNDLRQRLVAALNSQSSDTTESVMTRSTRSFSNECPHDPNIANHLSQELYGSDNLTAYELCPDDRPLMQCRYCLRYSLGHCPKQGGKNHVGQNNSVQNPDWLEPVSLRLGDGRLFRLEFDCKNCQMNIYAGSNPK